MTKTTVTYLGGCVLGGFLIAQNALAQTTTTSTTTTSTAPAAIAPTTTTTTTQQPPNGVEVEIGVGSRIGAAVSNYQTTNGTLALTSLGRATPQLLTGLGFSCDTSDSGSTVTTTMAATTMKSTTKTSADNTGFCNNKIFSHVGAFVSAQFGSGSSQTISGYSVGATYALGKYLRLLAGFSLTPVNEISPGFANAAVQYVTKNPGLFPGVNPAALSSGAYGAFDGIQSTSTAPQAGATPTSTIYYPGSVTETHYRGGLMIGIALPINIYNLLGGNSK